MKKKWNQCYLLLGNLVALILCCVCSFLFVNGNLKQAAEKKNFESIYVNTTIDFIIPGPSASQIADLEADDSNGIATVTPYYETSSPVVVKGVSASGSTAVIFPMPDRMEYTPYGSGRIISGESAAKGGTAVADQVYAEKHHCGIGDSVSISIAGHELSFVVSGIAETNTYYNNGAIALILTEEDAQIFEENGIRYSAAYVSASDPAACEEYLYSVYKPMSRLKDAADFENEEMYNQHLQNFNTADWSREITNCQANYNTLSVKYDNVESNIGINIAIMAVLVAVGIGVFNSILLTGKSMKDFFRIFLTRKSGTKKDVAAFYRNGIILNCAVFCVGIIVLYFILASLVRISPFGSQLLNCVIPVVIAVLVSVIMVMICSGYVEKHYRIKAIKKQDAPEEIQVEVI